MSASCRRLIVRTPKSLPDIAKMAMKKAGGHWDDLFSAYSFPLESIISIERMKKVYPGRWEMREFLLPEEHVKQQPKERFMILKYTLMMERLLLLERRLIEDLERYSKKSAQISDVSSLELMLKYQSAPDIDLVDNEIEYWFWDHFHVRAKECWDLRKEMRNVGLEIDMIQKKA